MASYITLSTSSSSFDIGDLFAKVIKTSEILFSDENKGFPGLSLSTAVTQHTYTAHFQSLTKMQSILHHPFF